MSWTLQKKMESEGKCNQDKRIDEKKGDNVPSNPLHHENIDAEARTSSENVGQMEPGKHYCCCTQLSGFRICHREVVFLLPEDGYQHNVGNGEDLEEDAK